MGVRSTSELNGRWWAAPAPCPLLGHVIATLGECRKDGPSLTSEHPGFHGDLAFGNSGVQAGEEKVLRPQAATALYCNSFCATIVSMKSKQLTSIRLSAEAKRLRILLAEKLGISQTAVLEIALREKAKREGVK